MATLYAQESYVNATRGYQFGDSEVFDTYCETTIDVTRYVPITITLIEEHRRSLKWRAECNACGFYAESMDRSHGDEIASLPVLVHADTHAA